MKLGFPILKNSLQFQTYVVITKKVSRSCLDVIRRLLQEVMSFRQILLIF